MALRAARTAAVRTRLELRLVERDVAHVGDFAGVLTVRRRACPTDVVISAMRLIVTASDVGMLLLERGGTAASMHSCPLLCAH